MAAADDADANDGHVHGEAEPSSETPKSLLIIGNYDSELNVYYNVSEYSYTVYVHVY